MLRPLLFLTAVCGTISTTSTGTTSEEPLGPTNEQSTIIDDVDTNTAIVTEVIDEIQKVTATGQSYPDFSDIEDHDDEVTSSTLLKDESSDVTTKSTTETINAKPTTSQIKQVGKPMKKLPTITNATNTTLPDSSEWTSNNKSATESSEHIQNTTNLLQTIINQRTENTSTVFTDKSTLHANKLNYSTTNVNDNLVVNNFTTEFMRITNATVVRSTSLKPDTTTTALDTSTVKGKNSSEGSSLFLFDSTSSTSLPSTVGAESTTTYDDSREYTSPRPSLKVEDTLQASRIEKNVDRALKRRKYINHAALWITIGFVVVLASYIVVLVVYNRTKPDWQPSSQEYQRFEDEAPEVSTATTGCSTDDDNVSNHSTDAMTQTHPFLETIGCGDREITGYYSDSEQLYRQ